MSDNLESAGTQATTEICAQAIEAMLGPEVKR